MKTNNILMELLDIEGTLIQANKIYDETGEDGIPEHIYNDLMYRLEELDPGHELLHRVAAPVVNSQGKIIHKKPMLSLEKVYSVEDLKKWMTKVSRTSDEKFICMGKFDGIASRREGNMLSTRGDGVQGENISHRLNLIEYDKTKDHDGELLITDSNFKNIVENSLIVRGDGSSFKNSRNAVSGIMRSEHEIVWKENWLPIYLVPYDYKNVAVTIDTVDSGINLIRTLLKNYPTDGFVIKLEDEEYGESLGHTSHHYKHSIALKEAETESAKTTLIGVEFNVAKEYIGMVGLLTPVELGGVTISRVSLHNMDFVKSLNLKIGDDVSIKRAGEVIPHIIESFGGGSEEIVCTTCPSCGGEVELDGQFWKCYNEMCPDKVINKIVAACKDLGIKGIAESSIRKIYETIEIDIADLLTVSEVVLIEAGWKKGSKSTKNILKELKRVKKLPIAPHKVFAALNIPGFGSSLFEKLFEVTNWSELALLIDMKKVSKLEDFPNMSTVRANQLIEGFDSDLLEKFSQILNFKDCPILDKPEQEGSKMKTICFTGKMPEKRADLEDCAIKYGYNPVKTVNKALDILVVEDPTKNSNKQKKAISFGTTIVSRNEFYKMVGK